MKFKEFLYMWISVYGKKDESLKQPFLSDLQNKFILLSEQIALMLSASPPSAPKELCDNISCIITKISDLGRKQFYIDGGRSVDEFNTLGDDGAKIIEDTIEQLEDFSLPCDEEKFD